MFNFKRGLMIAAVLALGILGIMPVSAQDDTAAGTAWLGVSVMDTANGVLIGQVISGSPADEAGLQHGDIIQAVDGTAIDSAEALVEAIQGYAPGDDVTLTVLSGDETSDVTVTLAERPSDLEAPGMVPNGTFGFTMPVEPHTGMLAMLGLDITVTEDGFQIDAIAEGSPLADSGLQAGDVITKIDGDPVLEAQPGMMFEFRVDQPVVFTVLRDGEEMDVDVTIDWTGTFQNIMPMQPGWNDNMPMEPGQGFNYGWQQQPPSQLGVQFRTLTPDNSEGLPVQEGAQIVQVFDNTPAAQAGLRVDDIITAVDGDAVDEEHTLADRLYAYEEGDTVTFTVMRGEEEMSIDVILGPRAPYPMGGQFGGPWWDGQGNMPFGNGMMPHMRGRGNNDGQGFRGRGNNGGMFWFYHGTPNTPDQQPTPEATPEGPAA